MQTSEQMYSDVEAISPDEIAAVISFPSVARATSP